MMTKRGSHLPGGQSRMLNGWVRWCGSREVHFFPLPRSCRLTGGTTPAPPGVQTPQNFPRTWCHHLVSPPTPRRDPLAGWPGTPSRDSGAPGVWVDGRSRDNATAPLPCTLPTPGAPYWKWPRRLWPNPGGTSQKMGGNSTQISGGTGMESRAGEVTGFPGHPTQRPG